MGHQLVRTPLHHRPCLHGAAPEADNTVTDYRRLVTSSVANRPAHDHPTGSPAHTAHGRFAQVPHIAGLVLGVFSVLVFLWSISPVLRYLVHDPREYVDNYYFDAPDTSLVVGPGARAARGGAREPQADRVVAAHDLPDRCSR